MKPAFQPVPQRDPAGLDELLLAAGKGVTRFLEGLVSSKLGRPVNIWDGPDGLGAVLKEHIDAAGVPNKRLPELLTPRLVVNEFAPKPRKKKSLRGASRV